MSVYSGPSPFAMDAHEAEQLRDYEDARGAFEYMLENDVPDLANWFGSSWVEYEPVLEVIKEARDKGSDKARELLSLMAHDYARLRTWP
jgi:hypothetical protein